MSATWVRPATRAGWLRAGLAAAVLAASSSLVGCDSSEAEDPSASGASASSSGQGPAGQQPRSDMVAAVSAGTGAGLVDLKFSLAKRPVVGEPLDVEFALTPTVELERLLARFQVTEGLELVSGAQSGAHEDPVTGESISHKLTVLPKQDGIFAITAVVIADSPKQSVARTFSIPLIAGAGLQEPAPAAADPNSASAKQ